MGNSLHIGTGSERFENPEHQEARELTGSMARCADRRRLRLEDLIFQCEVRIVEAERRIERHHQLWDAADEAQRQAHVHLEYNLLEGLKLLHTHHAMLLHELRNSQIPRCLVAPQPSQDETEQADAARYEDLKQTTAWLVSLATAALGSTIAAQRHRALYEMWQIQKRQLRRRAQLLS